MKVLRIYSTLGCHLCEQAKAVLEQAQRTCVFEYTEIDIADDDNLLELYSTRIPVIKIDQAELDWPFDLAKVTTWLASIEKL